MATPIQTPLTPFTSGLISVARIKGTTYTSGVASRLVVVQAHPAASGAYAVFQVKDNLGTFRDAESMENTASTSGRVLQAVVPPLTDYRFMDSVGVWTVDGVWEAN